MAEPSIEYKLYAVRIFTEHFENAIDFYQSTLGMTMRFCNADFGWAEFELGGSAIGIERVDPGDMEHMSLVGRFAGVSLAVPDIQAVYERLVAQGVTFVSSPEPQDWGGILAHFADPDKNILTLVQVPE